MHRHRILAPLVLLVLLALLTAACGGSSSTPATITGEELSEEEQQSVEENQARLSGELPAISPGEVAQGRVEIDGTRIDYFTSTPAGFAEGDTAPVVLAMPPGGQSVEVTQRMMLNVYHAEAVARGWVVVSPAAPGGRLFFDGSENRIPGFLEWVDGWVTAEGGRPHLIGVSNGGLSAFRLAAEQPEGYASIIAFPGFPRSGDTAALSELTDIPIRLFVGELDTPWITPMESARDTVEGLGGDIELEIVPNEGHIIQGLQDGQQIFELLDSFR